MDAILNLISTSGAFIFGVGIIYVVLDVTIGRVKLLHSKYEWNGLQVKDFTFLLIAALFLLLKFDFYHPF